jgi:hypothetical protein
VPLAEPARELLSVTVAAVPAWVERCVDRVLAEQGIAAGRDVRAAAARAAVDARAAVAAELGALLAQDVDDQRRNPLAVLRAATRFPTAVLREAGAAPVRRDEFQRERFPDDVYDLSPATWQDVDPGLHGPGIVWGAWKARTILDRRAQDQQAEGQE